MKLFDQCPLCDARVELGESCTACTQRERGNPCRLFADMHGLTSATFAEWCDVNIDTAKAALSGKPLKARSAVAVAAVIGCEERDLLFGFGGNE